MNRDFMNILDTKTIGDQGKPFFCLFNLCLGDDNQAIILRPN